MLLMAKTRKPKAESPVETPKRSVGRPPRTDVATIHAEVDSAIVDAFDQFMASQSLKPTRTSAIETALREFLEARGFWPPKKT